MQHTAAYTEIKHIEFDFKFLDKEKIIAKEIVDKLLAADFKPESGLIELKDINKKQKILLLFSNWVSVNNEIIDNLNIILKDIKALPYTYILIQGDPLVRYKLLIRMFFYEFYRFREKYNQIIKDFAKREFVDENDVPALRKIFHDTFKETIELRNRLVHGEINWSGEPISKLTLISMAKKSGHAVKSTETDEILSSTKILSSICAEDANLLLKEGNRVSIFLSSAIKLYAENLKHIFE